MIDIMDWDDWIKLTDAEQEAVRQRYERPDSKANCICQDEHRRGYCTEPGCPYSEALPQSLSVEDQRRLLEQLQCAETIGLET